MHRKVRSYLQIEQDITISFGCVYTNNCSNLVENVSTCESTPIPLPFNTVDHIQAFNDSKMPISVKASKGLDSSGNKSKQNN